MKAKVIMTVNGQLFESKMLDHEHARRISADLNNAFARDGWDSYSYCRPEPLPIYINGILATKEDMTALEHDLRLGRTQASAICGTNGIFYKTRG